MKVGKLLLFGFLAVAVVGGAWMAKEKLGHKTKLKVQEAGNTVKEKAEQKKTHAEGKLKEMMQKGEPMKCKAVMPDNKGTIEFYTDGKGRMLVLAVYPDADGQMHSFGALTLDEKSYSWNNDTKKGMITTVTEDDDDVEENDNVGLDAKSYIDETLEDYDCQPWRVDKSKFAPPTDVEFTDMNDFMAPMKDQAEKACDQVSGQEKEDCLKAIKSFSF